MILADNRIYQGDCRKLIGYVPAESVDLVIADPPFGIDFKGKPSNYNRTAERVLDGYADEMGDYLNFSRSWISKLPAVLKETGSAFIFSGWNNLKDVLIAIDESGLVPVNHLIWKYQFGVYTRRRFVTSHYHIVFAAKNPKKYKFHKIERYPEDVIIIKREYWSGKIKTPTKLPLALVERLILYTTDPNDMVLDPFMGSGTTAVAALRTGRRFLGFEIVPEYVRFAEERVGREMKNRDLCR
ncbi:MAG: site-specific DNA-methyltransferase [candidate division WOR-3 bacterium]